MVINIYKNGTNGRNQVVTASKLHYESDMKRIQNTVGNVYNKTNYNFFGWN